MPGCSTRRCRVKAQLSRARTSQMILRHMTRARLTRDMSRRRPSPNVTTGTRQSLPLVIGPSARSPVRRAVWGMTVPKYTPSLPSLAERPNQWSGARLKWSRRPQPVRRSAGPGGISACRLLPMLAQSDPIPRRALTSEWRDRRVTYQTQRRCELRTSCCSAPAS
jgi:hypothetical protein